VGQLAGSRNLDSFSPSPRAQTWKTIIARAAAHPQIINLDQWRQCQQITVAAFAVHAVDAHRSD
jgi:hypothetical protein